MSTIALLLLISSLLIGIPLGLVLWQTQVRLKKILRAGIVVLPQPQVHDQTLPFGNLGIVHETESQRIQVLLPILNAQKDVEYFYAWYGLDVVGLPRPKHKGDIQTVAVLKRLAMIIKEHVQFIEPEILELQSQYRKISELLALVTTSEFYASRQQTYQRALIQVRQLLTKAEELEQVYLKLIREVLIGQKVMGYDPSLIVDQRLLMDQKCAAIRAEYQQLKETAIAYAELSQSK